MVDGCDEVVVGSHLDVHHGIGNLIVREVAFLRVFRLGTAARHVDLSIAQVVVEQVHDDADIVGKLYELRRHPDR